MKTMAMIKFPLILRADYDGVHSGTDLPFTWSKYESPDLDLQATALRESREEIGVRQSDVSYHRQTHGIVYSTQ